MFFSEARKFRLFVALIFACSVALLLSCFIYEGSAGLLQAGDFPGFYVLPEILNRGLQDQLYNADLQRQIQNEYWPAFDGAYYQSVYPPFTAYLLYPLVFFGPRGGQFVWTFLSLLSLAFSYILVKGFFKIEESNCDTCLKIMLLVLTAPVFYAVFGAQNSTFSSLLLVLALLLSQGKLSKTQNEEFEVSPSKTLALAIVAIAWCYKPQFGALLLLALFVHHIKLLPTNRRTSASFIFYSACGGIFLFFASACILGLNWISIWLTALQEFSGLNYQSNQSNQVSLVGVISSVVGVNLPLHIIFLPALTASLWVGFDWKTRAILLAPFITLLSPQTLFYDLTIPLVILAGYFQLRRDRDVVLILSLCGLFGVFTLTRQASNGYSLVFMNLLIFLAFLKIYSSQKSSVS